MMNKFKTVLAAYNASLLMYNSDATISLFVDDKKKQNENIIIVQGGNQ